MRAALILALGAAVAGGVVAGCHPARTESLPRAHAAEGEACAAPAVAAVAALPEAADGGAAGATGAADAGAVEVEAPAPPATVRVSVRSVPRAAVQWGRKSLGTTPIAIERPRESGPMDLVLRAQGYLPFHTRAYTFKNDSLSVEMVRFDRKETLLGARKAPPAPPDGGAPSPAPPDGGAR